MSIDGWIFKCFWQGYLACVCLCVGTFIAVNQGDGDIWIPTGLRVLHHTALLSHRNQPDELLLVDFLNFCLFEAGSFWPQTQRDLPASASWVMEPKGCITTARLRQGLAMQSKLNLNLLHSSGWPYLLNLLPQPPQWWDYNSGPPPQRAPAYRKSRITVKVFNQAVPAPSQPHGWC